MSTEQHSPELTVRDVLQQISRRVDVLETDVRALDAKVDARFDAQRSQMDTRFNAQSSQTNARFRCAGCQIRRVFAGNRHPFSSPDDNDHYHSRSPGGRSGCLCRLPQDLSARHLRSAQKMVAFRFQGWISNRRRGESIYGKATGLESSVSMHQSPSLNCISATVEACTVSSTTFLSSHGSFTRS